MSQDKVGKILGRRVKSPKKLRPPKTTPLKLQDIVSNRRARKPLSKPIIIGSGHKLVLALTILKAEDMKYKILGPGYRSYIPSRTTYRMPGKRRYSAEDRAGQRNFATNIGFNVIKPYTGHPDNHEDYHIEWQKKLAEYAIQSYRRNKFFGGKLYWRNKPEMSEYYKNKKVYDSLVKDARRYLIQSEGIPAGRLHPVYFAAKYGREKVHRLNDKVSYDSQGNRIVIPGDPAYKALLKFRKTVSNKTDLRKVESLIRQRKKQLRYTRAEYEYKRYLRATVKHDSKWHRRLTEVILKIENPSDIKVRKYMFDWAVKIHTQAEMARRKEIYQKMHNYLTGGDLQLYLGKSADDRPYRGLIEGLITCLNNFQLLNLDSTNKGALRRSLKFRYHYFNNPELLRAANAYADKEGAGRKGMQVLMEYFHDQFANPEKTSRSGSDIPELQSLNGYSQDKHLRIKAAHGFPGLSEEQESARGLEQEISVVTPEAKKAFQSYNNIQAEITSSYRNYLEGPIELQADEFIKLKREFNKNRRKVIKK